MNELLSIKWRPLNQTRNKIAKKPLTWGWDFLNILFYLSESKFTSLSSVSSPGYLRISGLKVSSNSGGRDSSGTWRSRSQRDLTGPLYYWLYDIYIPSSGNNVWY